MNKFNCTHRRYRSLLGSFSSSAASLKVGILWMIATVAIAPTAFAQANNTAIHAVEKFPYAMEVSQKILGENGCGPTALFFFLKSGAPELRNIYDTLPGVNDGEKLKNLTARFGAKPSRLRAHESRFEATRGMAVYDLFAMALDALTPLPPSYIEAQSLNRRNEERVPGSLVKRAYFTLKKSLDNQIPVIANILPYISQNAGATWTEYRGHFIVITQVPKHFKDDLLGFSFKYFDPESGRTDQAHISEEVNSDFMARQDFPNGMAQWIHPKVFYNGNEVSSPFLRISTSPLNIAKLTSTPTQKIVMALTTVIGHF